MKTLKTWADLSDQYSLVLFNKMIKLEDGAVYNEYMENIELSEYTEEELDNGLQYEQEVYQWYLISVSEDDAEYLNKEFNLNIFYSDTLDAYVLPVSHFGTGWSILNLKGGYATD